MRGRSAQAHGRRWPRVRRASSVAAAVALLLVPALAAATPHAQVKDGWCDWGCVVLVDVQPGTRFELHGLVGDFDVYFHDADGRILSAHIDCGPDEGLVPLGAVAGRITMWDATGEITAPLAPCQSVPVPSGPAYFAYVDGL